MLRTLLLILLITSLKADYADIKLKDYIQIVAAKNKINIILDRELNTSVDIFINTKINKNTTIDMLSSILQNRELYLVNKIDYYYITDIKEELEHKIDIVHLKEVNSTVATKILNSNVKQLYKSFNALEIDKYTISIKYLQKDAKKLAYKILYNLDYSALDRVKFKVSK